MNSFCVITTPKYNSNFNSTIASSNSNILKEKKEKFFQNLNNNNVIQGGYENPQTNKNLFNKGI